MAAQERVSGIDSHENRADAHVFRGCGETAGGPPMPLHLLRHNAVNPSAVALRYISGLFVNTTPQRSA